MWSSLRGMGSRGVNAAPISNFGLPAANQLQEKANRYEAQGNLAQAKACFEAGIQEAEAWLQRTCNEAELKKTNEQLAASYFYYGMFLRKHDQSGAEENYKKAMEYARHLDVKQPEARMLHQRIIAGYGSFLIEDEKANEENSDQLIATKAPVENAPSPKLSLVPSLRPNSASIQEKSKQADYLFEKALLTLSSLELSPQPSLFLVYAHDKPAHGQAQASIAKYLIEKLSKIRVNLYSDQTPMGQPYSSASEELKNDGKLDDILTSQLCLLPDQLRGDVTPVDKVAVCCSEVLGSYLKWPHYEKFYQALEQAYLEDREAYRRSDKQQSYSAIREVVRKFSQEEGYKAGFHHVLTEMAFLQIRAAQLKDGHGIIPVVLTLNSYQPCLAHFIDETTVRVGDIYRLERRAQAGQEIYPNQSRHLVLFKLIERLFVGSNEAKAFLDKFWTGYSDCIARLNHESSPLSGLAFCELVDGIFDGIQKEQYRTQQQRIAQTLVLHKEIVKKLLPPALSSADLRKALYKYYQLSNLSIQRVSGKTIGLDDCYINLAIVESHAQREKDKKELEKQAEAFERLPSSERLEETNPSKLIQLKKLFDVQILCDGSEEVPKRILIQGRAGIGKTTLCKKLVYEYHQNELWQDKFDCVLWIPLRELKTNSAGSLEELLRKSYFASQGDRQALALAEALHQKHRDKTLFILDGLDEVVGELYKAHDLSRFLKDLLNQEHVIITSRPARVNFDVLDRLDLELETVGFSPENVQTYITKFVLESDQEAIRQFIRRAPLVQGLVNIPIQLDALCYSWDRLPHHQTVTVTMLYEAMVDKLWRKDGPRLEESKQSKPLGPFAFQALPKARVEKIMASEIHYLSYLAFQGLETGKIEFSLDDLDRCQTALENHPAINTTLPDTWTLDLKKTSYLHTTDAERPEAERYYHFLHLTFQEFFAAKFLVHHMQKYGTELAQLAMAPPLTKALGVAPSMAELQGFIARNKYNPRYEIVWWMVAGLLKGPQLEHFFTLLEESPRDIIGGRHQQVMMGCLTEARSQLSQAKILELEQTFKQSLHFEIKGNENGLSGLGRQLVFPEHLLLKELNQSDDKKEKFIQILGSRSVLSEGAIFALIDLLNDKNKKIREGAVKALSEQEILPESANVKLNEALSSSDERLKSSAVKIIENRSAQLDVAILRLINELFDEDKKNRIAAAQALGRQESLPERAISALTKALQDNHQEVRLESTKALRTQKILPETTILNLIHLLQNESKNESKKIKYEVIDLLGEQENQTQAAISVLYGMLQDEDKLTRHSVILALCKQSLLSETVVLALTEVLRSDDTEYKNMVIGELLIHKMHEMLPESIISALIDMLQDQDTRVRAIEILGKQKTLPDSAISALCLLLEDSDLGIRGLAASALRNHNTLPLASILDLSTKLEEENESVRANAFKKLSEQKNLPDSVISMLINAIKDPSIGIRTQAIQALYQQKTLSEAILSTLEDVLLSDDKGIRIMGAVVLFTREALPEIAIPTLFKTLQDENENIRALSALILVKHKTLPEAAVSILSDKLKNNDVSTRSASAQALAANDQLPENAIFALSDALQDESEQVRKLVSRGLGKQKFLPRAIISAWVDALNNGNEHMKPVVLQRLSKEETLPENAISLWIQMLQDENESVRDLARGTLRRQKKLSEGTISDLTDLLQSDRKEARDGAAIVLESQKTLPEITISALINALQVESTIVRYWAAKALGKQEKLSKKASLALSEVLLNDDVLNRIEAAKVLGNQKMPPKAIVFVLNQALTMEEDWRVKDAIASALSEQKTLPLSSIPVLIKLLQDDDEKVRLTTIWALSCHIDEIYRQLPNLSPEQIQFLYTKVLFPHSCKRITSLIIQNNQLQFDTIKGQRQSIELPHEQIERIMRTLLPVRVEAGVV